MARVGSGGRRNLAYVAILVVSVIALAGIVGGPLLALLVTGLSAQLVVAPRWLPALGRAVRTFLVRVVPGAIGCLAVVVALDFATGATWQRATGEPGTERVPPLELATTDLPPATDKRSRSNALAGEAWVDRYFAEMAAVPSTYAPFIGPREAPVHGRFVNAADGIRSSYEPPGADGDDAVDVWFFGGSTMWGEGQRDRHTIPSEVARLAEGQGVTLRVANYGVRGYTAFQEFLVFEQELARRDPPDLAVFYHGLNEMFSLLEDRDNLGRQPSVYQIDVTAEAFGRAPPLPDRDPADEPSVARTYAETSLFNKALRGLGGMVEAPAGADEAPFHPTEAQFDRALNASQQIYRRSLGLIRHVAHEHQVPSLIFWQPGGRRGDNTFYNTLSAGLADAHIDITDSLDDPPSPIYIDAVHTNEVGARLSATAIWAYLSAAVDGLPDR